MSAPEPIGLARLREAATGPLAGRVSLRYLGEHGVLPLQELGDGTLRIAVAGSPDVTVLDELSLLYDRPLEAIPVEPDALREALLSAEAEAPADLAGLREGDLEVLAQEEEALDDLRTLASQAPVIKLVNFTILDALRRRASDVHFESTGDALRVRYRVDGVLHDAATHPRQLQAAVVSRIKIMASLNIAERRVPQDGRVRLRLADRELDLRVSTLPAVHGENVVLRILDRGAGVRDLTELGMEPSVRDGFARLVTRPNGIVLVTGPTGSGKTTTLYAALQRINAPGAKIITVEDPVEYQLAGVTQIQVNPKAGRTFAAVLRSLLRHDPDIVMVGEMRDRETAEIAIQAALTGHLVFSTLHTNDAPGGITRLLDMGIEPYLLAATVQGLLAQRLLRTICEACAESVRPSPEARAQLAAAGVPTRGHRFRRGRGCERCGGTGYYGRTGVYELLVLDDTLRERIVQRASLEELRSLGRARGLAPLHTAAWVKAAQGSTTPEEVLRVTWNAASP